VSHGAREEAILACGVRWEETNPEQLARIRRSLLQLNDYDLRRILSRLKGVEICAPETREALTRTPKMQQRLPALGLVKKAIPQREKRRNEVTRLMFKYDRAKLYEQVWSNTVQEVAKSNGVSGVRLGKICRALRVPVPPRGYWARARSGYTVKRPPLPTVE